MERLLICARCVHLLEKEGDRYKINPELVPFLSRKSERYCGERFTHYFKTSYKIFDHLLPAVQENKPQWEKIGKPDLSKNDVTSIYTYFIYSNEKSATEFLSTMWASGYLDSLDLCEQISFAGAKKLVDLGSVQK